MQWMIVLPTYCKARQRRGISLMVMSHCIVVDCRIVWYGRYKADETQVKAQSVADSLWLEKASEWDQRGCPGHKLEKGMWHLLLTVATIHPYPSVAITSKVPRVRYTAAEKRIKKAEKGKRKKEKEIKASCSRSDGGIHGLMIVTYAKVTVTRW